MGNGTNRKMKLKTRLETFQTRVKLDMRLQQRQKEVSRLKSSKSATGQQKPIIPFEVTDHILLVGEGNFSFAKALLSHPDLHELPASNITATSNDSESLCAQKYPDSIDIIQFLRSEGVHLYFEIDATAIERCAAFRGLKWNRVVWNYPHSGMSSNFIPYCSNICID